MQRCDLCGGRLLMTSEGTRCMNTQCDGSKETKQTGVMCKCGEQMSYKGLNSWGEPNYVCMSCGTTAKL